MQKLGLVKCFLLSEVFQILGRSLNQRATLRKKEEQAVRIVWACPRCQHTLSSKCCLGTSKTCGILEGEPRHFYLVMKIDWLECTWG